MACGCHTLRDEGVAPLRGRLVLDVDPNPLLAVPAGHDRYELSFDIIMREAGGVGVRIESFTVEAIAFHTVTVQSQTFPAAFITERGYPARIEAGKYLRFSFTKHWQLPTRLLLSGASARVTARTVDDNGVRSVTVTRIGVVVAATYGFADSLATGTDLSRAHSAYEPSNSTTL
jgi:hypothetical protein